MREDALISHFQVDYKGLMKFILFISDIVKHVMFACVMKEVTYELSFDYIKCLFSIYCY